MNAILIAARGAVVTLRSPQVVSTVVKVGKYTVKLVAACTAVVAIEETIRRLIYKAGDALSNFSAKRQARKQGRATYMKEKTRFHAPRPIRSVGHFLVGSVVYVGWAIAWLAAVPLYLLVRPVFNLVQYLLGLPVKLVYKMGHGRGLWSASLVYSVLSYPFWVTNRGIKWLYHRSYRGVSTWQYNNEPVPVVDRTETPVQDKVEVYSTDDINPEAVNDLVRDLVERAEEEEFEPVIKTDEAFHTGEFLEYQDPDQGYVTPVLVPNGTDTVQEVEVELSISFDAIRRNARAEGHKVAQKLHDQDPILVGEMRSEIRSMMNANGITQRQVDQFFAGYNQVRKPRS